MLGKWKKKGKKRGKNEHCEGNWILRGKENKEHELYYLRGCDLPSIDYMRSV